MPRRFAPRRTSGRREARLPHVITAFLLGALRLSVLPAEAVETGPQAVVRQFCQADGVGQRVTLAGWGGIAPLVSWTFEPAWDRAVLIAGYEVGTPRPSDAGRLAVEVRYTVVGQVSALGFDANAQVEAVTFDMGTSDGAGWRIFGPPPPPHIFSNRVDVDQMRRSFAEGGMNFLANTIFVWQMLHSAGWNVSFETTADLLNGAAYRIVDQPKTGDLVVYLRDNTPYHVALLEGEHQVVSSTLNAGIVRTATDAFPGDVKYLRLVEPAAAPTPGATPPSLALAPVGPLARPARTPTPVQRPATKPSRAPRHRTTQPSATRRVEHTRKKPSTKRPHSTPTPRPKPPEQPAQ